MLQIVHYSKGFHIKQKASDRAVRSAKIYTEELTGRYATR